MVLKVDPSHLEFAIPMANINKACRLLEPYKNQFNRLSVKYVTDHHTTETIIRDLDELVEHISTYGSWKANALAAMKEDETQLVIKTMFDVGGDLGEKPTLIDGIDPRRILDLDKIVSKVVPKITNIWFTLFCTNDQTGSDLPLYVYQRRLVKLTWDLVTTLDSALKVFNIESPINKFVMLGYEIHPGIDPSCEQQDGEYVPEFMLHDEVVAFSQEEIEAENRRQAEAAAAAEREKRLASIKQAVKEHADLILKCYDRHVTSGNLEKFNLSEEGLRILKNPASSEECDAVDSLYRFLLMMAETSRCMPGEEMSDSNKIMGSFMELEKDVLTYHQRFLLNIFPGHLSHNDVLASFQFFGTKLQAQYIDTKEFIEKPSNSETGPKTVHLFV